MNFICMCEKCGRQYRSDGSENKFHCVCGALVVVSKPKPHTSAVIRCSSCGGARVNNDDSCSFCGSHFTIHEKDLDTVCPKCFTRMSGSAKFCHHCGIKIHPVSVIKRPSDRLCPVCLKPSLAHREFGQRHINILECKHCAGIWLDHATFRHLEKNALERGRKSPPKIVGKTKNQLLPQKGPFYRKCPECNEPMIRRNYGGDSAVIIDICTAHGLWLDDKELQQITSWIEDNVAKDTTMPRTRPDTKRFAPLDHNSHQTSAAEGGSITIEDIEDLTSLVAELFFD